MEIQSKNFIITGDKSYTVKNVSGKVLAKDVSDFELPHVNKHLIWIQQSQGQSIIDYTGKPLPGADKAEKCVLDEKYGTYCVCSEHGRVQKHHFIPKEGESHDVAVTAHSLNADFLKLMQNRINQRG